MYILTHSLILNYSSFLSLSLPPFNLKVLHMIRQNVGSPHQQIAFDTPYTITKAYSLCQSLTCDVFLFL